MYKCARKGVGYLPQENSTIRSLTVWENLQCTAECLHLSKKKQIKAVEESLAEMKISHIAGQKAYTLSGENAGC
jgi:lipopolysaccharide export system ATP-binding protein